MLGSLLYLSELAAKSWKSLDTPYPKAPELKDLSGYINTDNISIASLKGKVVIVDFWTYSCINCIRTLPHLINWYTKYHDKGLEIIGVHTPEFDFEKNIDNVRAAVKKYGIKYPVVLDNDYGTWGAYQNRYWPHKFLIDANGYIRYHHIGEGGDEETESVIKALLLEAGQDTSDVNSKGLADTTPNRPQTPELYVGYDFALPRGQNIGNEGGIKATKLINYTLPKNLGENVIYLSGPWLSESDSLTAKGDAEIVLKFLASAANIVVKNQENTTSVVIIDDDVEHKNHAILNTNGPRLYNVFKGEYGYYKLTLKVEDGFSFNAFTFG